MIARGAEAERRISAHNTQQLMSAYPSRSRPRDQTGSKGAHSALLLARAAGERQASQPGCARRDRRHIALPYNRLGRLASPRFIPRKTRCATSVRRGHTADLACHCCRVCACLHLLPGRSTRAHHKRTKTALSAPLTLLSTTLVCCKVL